MNFYTYSIFDSGDNGQPWPGKDRVEFTADDDRMAAAGVSNVLRREAQKLTAADGYSRRDAIHAIVWNENGEIIARIVQWLEIPQTNQ